MSESTSLPSAGEAFAEGADNAPAWAVAQRPTRRSATHARPNLAVADDDMPFLRVVNQVRGSRSLSCYDSAAAVLESAERARENGTMPWDAVLVSIGLPDLHGNAVIARLRDWFPQLTIWAAIGAEESHSLIGAICAGADGYLIKTCRQEPERAALGALDQNRPPLSRSVAAALLQLAGDSLWSTRGQMPQNLPPHLGLSRQQLQLLRLIARGDSLAFAAERLELPIEAAWNVVREVYRHLRKAPLCVSVPRALRLRVLADLHQR
jgi:DNA-binding NarL/FixJ family response regulator